MSNVTNTTSISNYNVAVQKQSGRVGTVRYYTRNGLTYVRSAANAKKTNKRTDAQMEQRIKFASLQALYSVFGTQMRGAFPGKAANHSDANIFVRANQGEGCYMTKTEKDLNYSVALPVVMASGKLPEITCSFSSNGAKSNLSVGSLSISDTTTVKDLSAAIVTNNEGWKYGDKFTVIVLGQNGNFAKLKLIKIELSQTSETLLNTLGTFSVVMQDICFADPGDACVGFLHSDADGNVSYCKLAADADQQTTIESFLTDEKFQEAAKSYGQKDAAEGVTA